MSYYLGLMAGSSADGIDAAIIAIAADGSLQLVRQHAADLTEDLRQQLLQLSVDQSLTVQAQWAIDRALAGCFVAAATQVLQAAGLCAAQLSGVGVHGYTCLHQPNDQATPTSIQLVDANVLAASLSLPVVTDFRRMDIAAGGQGAPLAPAFHQALWAKAHPEAAVVNIGGMANMTAWSASRLLGFDTGPGNVLLDAWAKVHTARPFDDAGAWAATGAVNQALLSTLQAWPFFQQAPPKSTGRERFNLSALQAVLSTQGAAINPQDVQATIAQLTAWSIDAALVQYAPWSKAVYVCGGGVHNLDLMARLQAYTPKRMVQSTAALGWDPDGVEAAAFAWLAYLRLNQKVVPISAVTGAQRDHLLGAIYQPV